MIPSIPLVRPSSIEAPESFVNLEVGIPQGRSLSGWISCDQNVEGSRITRWQERQSGRREYSQIAQIASRVFREFGPQLEGVCILNISYRGVAAAVLTRILSSLSVALSNISRSMEDDEDEFRPSTPPPASMSDPAARAEWIVNGLLVTPPKPFSTRSRAAMIEDDCSVACSYELPRGTFDRPALRPLPQPMVADASASPPRNLPLPGGYQFATPPRVLGREPEVPGAPEPRRVLFT